MVLYSTTQGWSRQTIKANLQVFFFVNQVVILAGYWWAKVLTGEVWRLGADAGSGLTLRQMFDCKT